MKKLFPSKIIDSCSISNSQSLLGGAYTSLIELHKKTLPCDYYPSNIFSCFPFFTFWKEAFLYKGIFQILLGSLLIINSYNHPPKCGNHHINYLSNNTTYWINVPSTPIYISPASISLSNSIPLFQIYRRRVHFFCSLLSLQKKCILYYYLFGFYNPKDNRLSFLYHFQPSKTR